MRSFQRNLAMLCFAVLIANLGFAQTGSDLLTFYSEARDRAAKPPDEAALKVLCQKELKGPSISVALGNHWVSFLSAFQERVLLVAFTEKKMGNPQDAVLLHPMFDMSQGIPLPTALPRSSGTLDWAYLYDRNGDGRIDYLVYLQNAHPVLPDPLPADFPELPQPTRDGRITLTKPLMRAMIHYSAMVFRHYADDDFDGRIDGAVMEDLSGGLFLRDWIVYHASTPSGPIDEAWKFHSVITDKLSTVPAEKKGYVFHFLGENIPVTVSLSRITERLRLINTSLSECHISAQQLERGTDWSNP